jgi:hypothetical protein
MGEAKGWKLNHTMVAFEWFHPIIDGKCSTYAWEEKVHC